jgi:DNA topoisomerase VI subunit B
MADIINLAHYADALRNTGYKNVDSAIAEIIDNSLEADAKDVLVICDIDSTSKEINDIAILDNGTGMDLATLNISLSLGDSTRRDRKGIGRFGVGLPQASLFIAPKVEVYSWQNGIDNSYYVYLDINEIKEGKQKTIQDAIKKSIPSEYLNVIKSMSSTGSSVLGKMQFKEHAHLCCGGTVINYIQNRPIHYSVDLNFT